MARYALIDGYLDTMRTQIRWRRDIDDLVSEMEDHLYSTVENLLATGVEPKAAQRTTLDHFGEPKALAAVYASNDLGGIAVPTKNTIRAGTFVLVSAFFWLAAAAIYGWTRGTGNDYWPADYALFAVATLIGGVLGLLAAVGVSKRLGGLGTAGMVGLVITGIGVALSLVAAWMLPGWMGRQGVGMLIFGLAALRTGIAPRWSTLLTSSGFVLGIITFIIANAAKVGDRDVWGDYPTAWAIAGVVGMVVVAIASSDGGCGFAAKNPLSSTVTTTRQPSPHRSVPPTARGRAG